jgi:hypothetical protein
MTTYLSDHLRIPGGVPKAEGLEYLQQVEAPFEPRALHGCDRSSRR